jgi:hypothetical protein
MTRYERQTLSLSDGVCDVEGRIVEVLAAPRGGKNSITALVEVPADLTDREDVYRVGQKEPVEEISNDGPPYYCTGTTSDDLRCSREVDEQGGRCWDHPE